MILTEHRWRKVAFPFRETAVEKFKKKGKENVASCEGYEGGKIALNH